MGKIITLYGINNLGKSTQVSMTVERLRGLGLSATSIKYPIYSLEPTGPIIFDYLRTGNPLKLTPTEVQLIYIQNRLQFQPELEKRLKENDFIILEDYIGTGLAWGIGAGVSEYLLLKLNSCLLTEDLAICLDGDRFLNAKEKGHKHEEDDNLTKKVRAAHFKFAELFGWKIVNANRPVEVVGEEIFQIINEKFHPIQEGVKK
jgi:thymidylate kinase